MTTTSIETVESRQALDTSSSSVSYFTGFCRHLRFFYEMG